MVNLLYHGLPFFCCSYHLHELPLVMIFGIATTVSAVHRSLPHTVSSLLSMEKFQALPSSIYLSQVLDQVGLEIISIIF